jgi:hypothetical protein
MSEFMTGMCLGAAIGLIAAVAALFLSDLVWPTFPSSHKDL